MSFFSGLFGGGKARTTAPAAVSGLQLQSSAQGVAIQLVYGTTRVSPNLIWYGDFESIAQQSTAGGGGGKGGVGGGGGGKGGGGSTSYIYQTAVQLAICEGPIVGFGDVYVNKNITTTAALGFTEFLGSYPQSAWGYLTSNHPNQALPYNGIAHLDASSYALGNSPQLPNHNFEVLGIFSNSVTQEIIGEQDTIPTSPYQVTVVYAVDFLADAGVTDTQGNVYTPVLSSPAAQQYTVSAGVYTFSSANAGTIVNISYQASIGPDADPSLVINDLLTNAHYGAGFPSSRVGDLSVYQAYTIATGLLISPAYNQQAQASNILDDIATNTNSAFVWSSGVLNLIPYGDQDITANGYTYTAPSAPLYSLSDDDYMPGGNNNSSSTSSNSIDPIILTRKRPADQINSLKLECLNRANQYNPAIIEAKDQALIDLYGLRQAPSKQTHLFANLASARLSAQLQLQRQGIRNLYNFTTDQKYILLDPMDIIEVSDSTLGIVDQWVRINEITENDDMSLTFVVEEYLDGTGNAPVFSFQSGSGGFNANYNASAGDANAPLIYEPPLQLCQTGGPEAWMSLSGDSFWGGCDVWISADGSNYKLAGRQNGPSRQGVLTGNLPVGTDPDTVDTLHVSLAMSFGELLSGTAADANNFNTLCLIDQELISYETATLVSTYNYNLTYLRRGGYGTTIASHANGASFARLDNGIFKYGYDKSQIGQTIYIKLLSFNIYGGGEQSLADVTPYTHVLTGPPLPTMVQNFGVSQNNIAVVFTWDDLVPDTGLKGYDIAYGPVGSAWVDKLLLTEAARATEMTNADVPPGHWEFSIRGHDLVDNLGPENIVEFVVKNPNSLVIDAIQEPDWIGAVSGFVRHPTGVLVPDSTTLANHTTDYTIFNVFVPDPVSSATYTSPINDVGYDTNLRVYSTDASALGPGETGGGATLGFSIDTWLNGGSDPNVYTPWTVSYVEFRYLKGRITYSGITFGNVSYISDFTILADVAPSVQQSGTLAVSPGGTTLTFPNPYHTAPYVTATVISSSGLYASVVSVTALNCIIHVWDHTGSDVGGTVNWNSNGS